MRESTSGNAPKSSNIVPKSLDKAMDKANPPTTNGAIGISIRNGPVEEINVDEPQTNGHLSSKRKARKSVTNGNSYKDASEESGDDAPLVR